MTEWLRQAGELTAFQLIGLLGGAAFLENLAPPLPMDMVLTYGGYLAEQTGLPMVIAWGSSVLGGWGGFMLVYVVGRFVQGTKIHQRWINTHPSGSLAKVEGWFGRFGFGVIAGNRFLVGARSVVALFGGLARLAPGRVALWSLVSLGLWNGLLVGIGFQLGQNWPVIEHWLATYRNIVFLAIGIIGVGWLWWRRKKKNP